MSAQAARFAAAYAALWAAHDVADHIVQTDHQAANKADIDPVGWRAMAGHVGGYHAVQLATVALLRTAGVRPPWWRILLAVAWSAGTHALLDRRWPVIRLLERTGSAAFAASAVVPAVLVDETSPEYRRERDPHAIGITRNPALPLHGPYLADQALHHAAIVVAAAILAGGRC